MPLPQDLSEFLHRLDKVASGTDTIKEYKETLNRFLRYFGYPQSFDNIRAQFTEVPEECQMKEKILQLIKEKEKHVTFYDYYSQEFSMANSTVRKRISVIYQKVSETKSCDTIKLELAYLCYRIGYNIDTIKNESIAFDKDTFVPRYEVENIKGGILNNRKITILHGFTGIGKTTIAEKLLIEFDSRKLLRVNFDDETQTESYIFKKIALRWLKQCNIFFSPEEIQESPDLIIKTLINHLTNNPFIILLDSLELILKGSQANGWTEFKDENWSKFLIDFLQSTNNKSRIIITTQSIPPNLSSCRSNFWREKKIKGFTTEQQIQLFKNFGISFENKQNKEETLTNLERIRLIYEGHPLCLSTIAICIKKDYLGSFTSYWNEEGRKEIEHAESIFSTKGIIDKKNSLRLHNSNNLFIDLVKYRLNKTLERVRQNNYSAYVLLCITSARLSASSKDSICQSLKEEYIKDKDTKKNFDQLREDAFKFLKSEDLIIQKLENDKILYTLHNLIRSVAYEHFHNLK